MAVMDTKEKRPRTNRPLTPSQERIARYRYTGKLTPRLREEAAQLVRKGVPPDTAIVSLGVTKMTLWNWKQWAKSGEKGPRYEQLFTYLEEAWEEWKATVANQLPSAISRDPRMAVEVAGRIMPDEYGKKDEKAVTFELGPFLADLCRKVSSGELDAQWQEIESGTYPRKNGYSLPAGD